MKYLVTIAPTLLLFCFAAILSMQPAEPPVPLTAAQRSAEIQQLQMERANASARISLLESEGRTFLPR